MKLLEVKNVSKYYKKYKAVDDISFDISKGEIIGLLGVNGAGKSTTINMISTILSPNSGKILFMGEDIQDNMQQYKKSIGVVPQDIAIYENISALDNLLYFGGLYGIKRSEIKETCNHILEIVGLGDRAGQLPKNFSGGMKRRLNIACGLLHNPQLVIMDEPTVGVDVQSRNFILNFILNLKKRGISVIYTTHYMEEVEMIGDRIIVIDKGKVKANGTMEEIRKIFNREQKISMKLNAITEDLVTSLCEIEGVKACILDENNLCITVFDNKNMHIYKNVIDIIENQGLLISDLTTEKENLENIFLNLTVNETEEAQK